MGFLRKEKPQEEPVEYELSLITLVELDKAMESALYSRADFNLLLRYANHTPVRHAKEPLRGRTLLMDIYEDISFNIRIAKKELRAAETVKAKKQIFQKLFKRLKELLEDHLTDKEGTPQDRRLQWNVKKFHADIVKDLDKFIGEIVVEKTVMQPAQIKTKAFQ